MLIAVTPERFVEVTAALSAAARKAVEKPTKAQTAEAEADGLTWEQVARYRREDLVRLVGGDRIHVDPAVYDTLKSDKGITVLVADETEINPLPDPVPGLVSRAPHPSTDTAETTGRRSAGSDTPPPSTDAPSDSTRARPRPRKK